MLNLSYADWRIKENAKEAIKIIDNTVKDGINTNNYWEKENIALMVARFCGWEFAESGKRAFIKDDLVVKIGCASDLIYEKKLWLASRYIPYYKKYRKNLSRIYGIYNGFLFQKKVNHIKECDLNSKEDCNIIAGKIGIEDWSQNHGHDSNGNPVWFDSFVRNYWDFDARMKSKENKKYMGRWLNG